MPTYEIRRAGQVICTSSIQDCGYPKDTLQDIERSGMCLYCDGKKVKSRPGRCRTESGKVM